MDFVVNSCDDRFMVCFDDGGDNLDEKDRRIGGKNIYYEMFRPPLVATFRRGTKPLQIMEFQSRGDGACAYERDAPSTEVCATAFPLSQEKVSQ